MEARLRLDSEHSRMKRERGYGFYAAPTKKDVFTWMGQIRKGKYYFQIKIVFPKTYPLDPPRVWFVKEMFHPNIYLDGSVCLDLLSTKWSPTITVLDILQALVQLLSYPNPTSPANIEAAKLCRRYPGKYKKIYIENLDKNHTEYCFIEETP